MKLRIIRVEFNLFIILILKSKLIWFENIKYNVLYNFFPFTRTLWAFNYFCRVSRTYLMSILYSQSLIKPLINSVEFLEHYTLQFNFTRNYMQWLILWYLIVTAESARHFSKQLDPSGFLPTAADLDDLYYANLSYQPYHICIKHYYINKELTYIIISFLISLLILY